MRGHWAIRLPTWLGDTVMAVPTIRALARGVDRLTLWGSEEHLRLLRFAGVVGHRLPFARRRGLVAVPDLMRAASDLRRLGIDGVLLLPNAIEPALTTRLAGIRRRVGYATEWRSALLTDAVVAPGAFEPGHDADRFAHLLTVLRIAGPSPEDARLEIPRGSDLAVRLLGDTVRPLGLVPGCANGPAKRWPATSFAHLAEMAAARWGATPVLLGGRHDVEAARELADTCRIRCIDLTGRTDVLELAAVLQACRAVVSNDTGAAHLSAALSSPTLQLFGPTDPGRTRARGQSVRVASIGTFCQPCMSKECPLDHRCMTGLAPELVMGALEPLWEEARSTPSS